MGLGGQGFGTLREWVNIKGERPTEETGTEGNATELGVGDEQDVAAAAVSGWRK